ncbi:MAG: type II toxin-antitoxin system VapC family toxin [Anaerolineae bacterium]
MTVMPAVCLDASFVVKLVLPEDDTPLAQAMLGRWLEAGTRAVGPTSVMAESCSVVWNRLFRCRIEPDEGTRAITGLLDLDIELIALDGLYLSAWALAEQLHQPTLYDCYYLAVAEAYDCEFWTADRVLYHACQPSLPWVRLLGSN